MSKDLSNAQQILKVQAKELQPVQKTHASQPYKAILMKQPGIPVHLGLRRQ
jgi:hypothetical protein